MKNFYSSGLHSDYHNEGHTFLISNPTLATTRKLKNRDGNLETKIFPSLFRHGKQFPSLFRDGKQFPPLFRDGKLFPSLFRYGKISVSKFPSLKVARYVPSKF